MVVQSPAQVRNTTANAGSGSRSARGGAGSQIMSVQDMLSRKFRSLIYSKSHWILSVKEKEEIWNYCRSLQGQDSFTKPSHHRYIWLKCSGAYNMMKT